MCRPLGNGCADYMTDWVLAEYIVPIVVSTCPSSLPPARPFFLLLTSCVCIAQHMPYTFPCSFLLFDTLSFSFSFSPLIQNKAVAFLDSLSDDSLKKEAATDAKSETFSSIMRVSCCCYVLCVRMERRDWGKRRSNDFHVEVVGILEMQLIPDLKANVELVLPAKQVRTCNQCKLVYISRVAVAKSFLEMGSHDA